VIGESTVGLLCGPAIIAVAGHGCLDLVLPPGDPVRRLRGAGKPKS